MNRVLLRYLLAASAWCGANATAAEPDGWTEGERLFALEVQPMFAAKCLACHGADGDDLKGAFDLSTRAGLLAGGESGDPGVTPGDHAAGSLYALLKWDDGYGMPPKEADRLTEAQRWAVRDWIDAGAPWPDAATVAAIRTAHAAGVRVPTSGGLSDDWTDRRYEPADVWAYRPIAAPPPPPNPPGFAPPADPADAFLNAKLAEAGLTPAPRADRRTLLRRATFDLTGLPPAPAEVAAFLADPRDDRTAFAAVVDRLLASPHYGERFATHWLDVVRYADSGGLANDFQRPNAWRYRDYVVRAFNDDKPFDRFLTEQLAGDELVDSGALAAGSPEGIDALIAPGFLRMGPWEHTGMSVAKVARQQFLDDVTDTVGQTFLAQPLQCAKCHDHKFDPIPTRDYYAIQASFATTQFAERAVPLHPREDPRDHDEPRYLRERIAAAQAVQRRVDQKKIELEKRWYAERGLKYAPRGQKQKQGVPEAEIAPKTVDLDPLDFGLERVARKAIQRHQWELDAFKPYAFTVYSGASPPMKPVTAPLRLPEDRARGEIERSAILTGGDPFSPGEPVEPGVLSAALLSVDPAAADPVPEAPTGRRLVLAGWLTDPANPLPARVYANRLWQWVFGRGLAANANNFGGGGAEPTHPELLDYLAVRLVEGGWRTKPLVRALLLSDAYARRSLHPDPAAVAAADPNGELLAVARPRRLTAEELRDAMLAFSGELNPAVGGVPVRPEIEPDVALQPRQVMGTFAPAWQPDPDPRRRHRRTLYALKLRGLRDPLLETFNAPTPDAPCERRETSIVAPQALALLNGRNTLGRALAAAAAALADEPERDADAVDALFRRAFSRPPTDAERTACLSHWHAMTARHASLHFDPVRPPSEVLRDAVEENTGERFSYVETLEQAADFIPDLGPAEADARTRGLAEVALVLLNANEFLYLD
ncbi:PSD1 and planctomycete cytochrome C domain-containing protein [Alienimonas californiensis]|uniref:Planctomycete cytochrome C n=1 Tax=Alienimonas californiensis TaxID=2527989 RepID=A0A517PCL5_9PLAN|nr:PSD1 and planctomycete cytochrome C domain-containing protein [Alienimonas californiensis]QDT17127.1 Planctomycete cytochrome C [Alienimonas californiensis]